MKKVLLQILIIIPLVSFNGIAQKNANRNSYWFEIGGGGYYNQKVGGINSAYWINYIRSNTLMSARFVKNVEFSILGPIPNESDLSLGIMLGKVRSFEDFHLSASIGLGITSGITRGSIIEHGGNLFNGSFYDRYEREKYLSPSIPIEINITLTRLKYLGLGAAVIGDANLKRPYLGLMLKAGLGKYR